MLTVVKQFLELISPGRRDQTSVRTSASRTSIAYTLKGSSDDQSGLCPTSETDDSQVASSSIQSATLPTSTRSFDIHPNSVIKQSDFPVASGGLGDVYKCSLNRDASPKDVSVKCPRFPSLGEAEIRKIDHNLDREIDIWGELEHQYVLPLLGTVKGFGPFRALVSPWMPNGTLNSYLNREGVALTTMDRLHILKQITEGLKYLHNKNVIHGDLTSNNVLIAADGSPRVADFGFSNIVVASNPAYSYHTGAIRWVAPEFIILPEDQTVQCATKCGDIYSLGCIMLEVLYGKLPYWWTKNVLQVVALKFVHQEPINNVVGIQAHHLNFMRRCWSTESESRPSVEEVLDFLEEAISNGAAST